MAEARNSQIDRAVLLVMEAVPSKRGFPRGWLESLVSSNHIGPCGVETTEGKHIISVDFGGHNRALFIVREDGFGDSGSQVYAPVELRTLTAAEDLTAASSTPEY